MHFKIKDMTMWRKERQKLINDVSIDLRNSLKDELKIMGYSPETQETIKYFGEDKVVGSEEFVSAVIDSGVIPGGRFPNFDRIKSWVKYDKDNGANATLSEAELDDITRRVGRKIVEEGIDPTWFVKTVLREFTR